MGGRRSLMAHPEGNDGDIVAGLQPVHGGGVPEDVRGNGPALQAGAEPCGLFDRALQAESDAKAG